MLFPTPLALVTILAAAECFLPRTTSAQFCNSIPVVNAKQTESVDPSEGLAKPESTSSSLYRSMPSGMMRFSNPMRRFVDMFDALEKQFFDEDVGRLSPFAHDLSAPLARPLSPWVAPLMGQLDISETDKEMKISVDLPGIKKEDIKIELDKGCLIISAERNEEHEEKTRSFRRQERSFGIVKRVVQVPENVDAESSHVQASFKDGVLHVDLQKVERPKEKAAKQIEIQ